MAGESKSPSHLHTRYGTAGGRTAGLGSFGAHRGPLRVSSNVCQAIGAEGKKRSQDAPGGYRDVPAVAVLVNRNRSFVFLRLIRDPSPQPLYYRVQARRRITTQITAIAPAARIARLR